MGREAFWYEQKQFAEQNDREHAQEHEVGVALSIRGSVCSAVEDVAEGLACWSGKGRRIEYRLQSTDYRVSLTEYKVQITEYKLRVKG